MSIRINDVAVHNHNASLTLTPRDLAVLFWELDNVQQAAFFNALAEIADVEASTSLEEQMNHIGNDDELSDEGRQAMLLIGKGSNVASS